MLATRSTPGLASWLMNFLATAGRHTSMEREYANAAEALRSGPGATVLARARADTVAGLRMFERTEVTDLLGRHGFTDIDRRIEGVTQTLAAPLGGDHA